MPENDLALLIEAARAAGEVASRHFGTTLDIQRKAHDQSPVTQADHAANAVLCDILRGARPDYGWLSEESPDDAERLSRRRVFVVDPIDGTRAFIDGERSWSHALAVVADGTVETAAVYLPLRDKLYTAARGGGAHLNGAPITVANRSEADDAEVLATRPSLDPSHWPGGVPRLRRNHRPSLAYRLSLVAEGRFDAIFTFRPTWEWDIAAGSLILTEAGARTTDRRGQALRFNAARPQADGLLAANPALHAALLQRLS